MGWRVGGIVAVAAWTAAQLGCGQSSTGVQDAALDSRSDSSRPEITLTPADTLFEINATNDLLQVVITNVSGACGYTQRNEVKAGARAISINVIARPVVPRTYTVATTSMPELQAFFLATDDACHSLFAINPYARDGSTVIIRSMAPDLVVGSYALDFGGGHILSGDFQAQNCSPLGHPCPTCVP